MPHSSFLPPQRPLRASAPASGIAVHGSQPMLVYPRAYSSSRGIPCASAYASTCGHRPVRQHAHLLHLLARRRPVVLHLFQPRARRRLLPPQPGKPPVKRLQRPHQRLHLADRAALASAALCAAAHTAPHAPAASSSAVHSPDSSPTPPSSGRDTPATP